MKDSLWSVDLFRCESILRSHWIMVVMDVFTRRIIGFGVERADPGGASICRTFNHIIAAKSLPRHLSSDHDPLYGFHRWLANLRILEIILSSRAFWSHRRVLRDEKRLEGIFGAEFAAYRARVTRWIPGIL